MYASWSAMHKMHSLISFNTPKSLLSQLSLVLPFFMQVANYKNIFTYLHEIGYIALLSICKNALHNIGKIS